LELVLRSGSLGMEANMHLFVDTARAVT
jgi:hypothetical protein